MERCRIVATVVVVSPEGESTPQVAVASPMKRDRTIARFAVRALALIGIVAVVGSAISLVKAIGDPEVVLEMSSDAVSLTLSDSVDLVGHARPRFGLQTDKLAWSGLQLDTSGINTILQWNTQGSAAGVGDVRAPVLQRLDVDSSCVVTLETRAGQRIDIMVHRSAVASCAFRLEMLYSRGVNSTRQTLEVTDTVPLTKSLNLLLMTSDTLQWRQLPVRRLSFVTSDFGGQKSSVRSGILHMRDYVSKSETIRPGDAVQLDDLSGRVLELNASSQLRTLYRGVAPHPTVAGHDLRPTLSEEVRSKEWFIVVVGLFGALTAILLPLAERLQHRNQGQSQ